MHSDVPWVVEAWRRRGLISGDAVISKEELAVLHSHSNSWFARRNRHSPHASQAMPCEKDGWLARRNRYPSKGTRRRLSSASEGKAKASGFDRWVPAAAGEGAIEAWVRAKLPGGSQSLRCAPAADATPPISPCTSRELLLSPGARIERMEHGRRPQVELTLYDLCTCCNGAAHRLGIGVYHSGIVIEGLEYTYDNVALTGSAAPEDSGVVVHAPYYTDRERQKLLPFRTTILLGESRLSARESHAMLRGLAGAWIADEYDMVEHNCHHFCAEAATILGVAPPPYWVSRAGEILRFFSGLPSERERARQAKMSPRGVDRSVWPTRGIKRRESDEVYEEEACDPLLGCEPMCEAVSPWCERPLNMQMQPMTEPRGGAYGGRRAYAPL